MRRKGINDLPRTLNFQPYDLLKTINRPTGGHQYKLLRNALGRLQSTTIQTNIRARRGKKVRQFSWIESYTDLIDEGTEESRGMSVTLADWFYEGVLMEGGVLSIDPVYFTISGGRERWLYRVARKHAGGAGGEGFAIHLRTLFQKSGAEGNFRRFKFEIQKIARRDDLPQYRLAIEEGRSDLVLRMTRRDADERSEPPARTPARRRQPAAPPAAPAELPLLDQLDDTTIERIRADFPGWDIYALKAEFDSWLADNPERRPRDYRKAFYGFVRNHNRQNSGP
jgi:plasmid replication initiation protein